MPCALDKVCCGGSEREGKVSAEIDKPGAENMFTAFQDLPETECPHQMSCVAEQLCDMVGSKSKVVVELGKDEKDRRDKLIVKTRYII